MSPLLQDNASADVLLIGGSGKLGRLVISRLASDPRRRLRLLTRNPGVDRSIAGARTEVIVGGIEDDIALAKALDGVDRLFLLTPIAADLAELQLRAIKVTEQTGVRRIVKISGSDWTIVNRDRSRAGGLHAIVEERLAISAIPSVSIRPNAWTQVSLAGRIAAWRAGDNGPPPEQDAPVAYIDMADIADVAVHALTSATVPSGPLVITGPEALTWHAIQSRLPSRPATEGPRFKAVDVDPFHADAVAEFRTLIAEGAAAPVTTTVPELLGRPARTVWGWINRTLGTSAQAGDNQKTLPSFK